MKYYFIGIKGSGMSSLAMLVKDKGNEVRGSDVEEYIFTEEELKRNTAIAKTKLALNLFILQTINNQIKLNNLSYYL